MPYHLSLPENLKTQGWKVKIREKERAEPPHVSILLKLKTWRWGLREQAFLDKKPPHRKIPQELLDYLQVNHHTLVSAWNLMYPHNPVNSTDSGDKK